MTYPTSNLDYGDGVAADANADGVPDTLKTALDLLYASLDSVPLSVVKTANETRISNVVTADDTDLILPVEADSNYIFEIDVIYSSSATADFQIAVNYPSGATSEWTTLHLASSAAGAAEGTTGGTNGAQYKTTNGTQLMGGLGVGARSVCQVRGTLRVGSTAGNLAFRWRQGTTEATDTVVHAGSSISARKIVPFG